MRVSCPFVLLAVFIAAQSEGAPVSFSNIVNHIGDVEKRDLFSSTNPLSGGLPMMSSVPGLDSLSSPLSGLTGNAGGLNPLNSASSMMKSIPAVGSLPTTSILAPNKRGLGNLPIIGSIPVLNSLPMENSDLTGSSSAVSSLTALPMSSIGGITSGLPMVGSALNSKRGLDNLGSVFGDDNHTSTTQSLPQLSGSPIMNMKIPILGSPADAVSGFVSSADVL